MKISARNQLKGKIVAIDHGVTTSHVKIDIGGRQHHYLGHHQDLG